MVVEVGIEVRNTLHLLPECAKTECGCGIASSASLLFRPLRVAVVLGSKGNVVSVMRDASWKSMFSSWWSGTPKMFVSILSITEP